MSDVPPSAPQPPEYQPGTNNPRAAAKAAKAYAKASRKWYQKKRWWVLAVIVVIIIIAASTSGGGGDSGNKPAASDNTGVAKGGSAAKSKSKSAPAAKSTAGQVLLHEKGNGAKTTEKFTADGDWDLAYTYDCSNFGQQGNFVVMVYGDDNNMSLSNEGVNLLGMKGHDVSHEHHGGTYYLSVNSECNWTLKVTSAS